MKKKDIYIFFSLKGENKIMKLDWEGVNILVSSSQRR